MGRRARFAEVYAAAMSGALLDDLRALGVRGAAQKYGCSTATIGRVCLRAYSTTPSLAAGGAYKWPYRWRSLSASERRQAIVDAARQGLGDVAWAARSLGIPKPVMLEEAKDLGIVKVFDASAYRIYRELARRATDNDLTPAQRARYVLDILLSVLSAAELGRLFGVTRERIRQIKNALHSWRV